MKQQECLRAGNLPGDANRSTPRSKHESTYPITRKTTKACANGYMNYKRMYIFTSHENKQKRARKMNKKKRESNKPAGRLAILVRGYVQT